MNVQEPNGVHNKASIEQLARTLGYRYLNPTEADAAVGAPQQLTVALARRLAVVPLRNEGEGGALGILTGDPADFQIADDLRFALGREIELVASEPAAVAHLLERYLARDALPSTVAAASHSSTSIESSPAFDRLAKRDEDEPAGASSWVEEVLRNAILAGASDVHFEPFDTAQGQEVGSELIVRQRVDGVLAAVDSPPREMTESVASRLKVLANLDIAERRLPQDGRIRFECEGRAVDLRISTLPTQFGESVVLRVLDPTAVLLALGDLGMPPAILAGVREVINRPHGMLVVTGPTSSGKTTTLYCALQELNSPEAKLLTIEDPVEYEIEGAIQVAVNPTAGLTFSSALRSFLRHDPDIVMVGEIRDEETARTAVQAALTGHGVLSTLHTNDAVGAVARLAELGVEPFLIASALEGVLAQRLVRRICPMCGPSRFASDVARCVSSGRFGATAGMVPALTGRATSGNAGVPDCPVCHGTGYKGRIGIFEWLPITESLREMITAGAPALELRRHAIAHGLRPLRNEGLRLVAEGVTTMDEVLRCT